MADLSVLSVDMDSVTNVAEHQTNNAQGVKWNG
jgi:hypothetical protein